MFVDYVKITIESGKGGNGCISFRREKYVPCGGPNGGDGGKGGDVIIEVEKSMHNLIHLYYTPHFKAESGKHGKGKNQHGRNGKDIMIKVPPGTVIYKAPVGKCRGVSFAQELRSGSPPPLADLIKSGEKIIVAKGGKGGIGNAQFKSSTNRAPRKCLPGEEGEKVNLLVELKLIADVGFVGYPNAGKSTLLARISNAKPKIANYPFTTLTPTLGTVDINYHKITFADIPGIIEGASKGKGLGLQFLRHIERTKLLVFVLDITQAPLKQYENLKKELLEYNPIVLKKPSVCVLNKIDLCKNSDFIGIPDAIPISALKGDGIDEFLKVVKGKIYA